MIKVFVCPVCEGLETKLSIEGHFIIARGIVNPGEEKVADLVNVLTVEVERDWYDKCFAVCRHCQTRVPLSEMKQQKLSSLTLRPLSEEEEGVTLTRGIVTGTRNGTINLFIERELAEELIRLFETPVVIHTADTYFIE